MAQRMKKAERIVAVQAQMHRKAEWELARISRERAALEAKREQMLETLTHDLFGPLLVEVVAKNLNRLADDGARLASEEESQTLRVREQALASKRAERMAKNVAAVERHAEEKAAFQELVESATRPKGRANGDASLA